MIKPLACLILSSLVAFLLAGPAWQPGAARNTGEMVASTVQIDVTILGRRLESLDGVEGPAGSTGWLGSGFVYGKVAGQPTRSLIMSAHHVFETPAVGSIVMDEDDIPMEVTGSVLMVITTDGRRCLLSPLALGDGDGGDVATGVAECDAGRPVSFAPDDPPIGSRVFVAGHPNGIVRTIVTRGRMLGWYGDRMFAITDAEARQGSSGSPVFNQGLVVGVVVRVGRDPARTYYVPLGQVFKRILETPPL